MPIGLAVTRRAETGSAGLSAPDRAMASFTIIPVWRVGKVAQARRCARRVLPMRRNTVSIEYIKRYHLFLLSKPVSPPSARDGRQAGTQGRTAAAERTHRPSGADARVQGKRKRRSVARAKAPPKNRTLAAGPERDAKGQGCEASRAQVDWPAPASPASRTGGRVPAR